MNFKTIEWKGDHIRILDQRRLPLQVHYLICKNYKSVIIAIKNMAIRGAPAIGVAAAMGVALGAKNIKTNNPNLFKKKIKEICFQFLQTRPTAVNLSWAIKRMEGLLDQESFRNVEEMKKRLEGEAINIYKEDIKINRRIGEIGKGLIQNGAGILTHCNAGALATAGYGTALGVLYAAWEEGKRFHVYVDETRPLLQGARLTAWELQQAKIPFSVLTDNMAGWLMKNKKIDLVIVGADRIAQNGDSANKIGTYSLAILAKYHHIPFYIAAPTSTIDFNLKSGDDIPIEERSAKEVTHLGEKRLTPEGIKVCNPAFDVTPHTMIDAIITEKGVIHKPFKKNLIEIKVR